MSTINSRACVVNGTPVDKVFSDGNQVYGRNLYFNSKAIADTYSSINNTTITIEPFDSTTNMWHIVAKQDTGTVGIFLPFTANGKLPDTSDWSYSADVKGTGKNIIEFGVEAGSKKPIVGTVGSEWSRISQAGHFDKTGQKTIVMYFDSNSSPVDVYIKLPKLETGKISTPWTPVPEDVLK